MKILHIFDHSIPLQSGYAFRSRAILEQQRAMGWETEHVTSIKHTVDSSDENEVDGFHFYRTCSSNGLFSKLPVLNQFDVVISLVRRLDQIITVVKPDILHAHSPCLNGLAALKVARKYK
ncbi:glycosyltransferase WbuB, partial [Pseudomonadota bacterium]